MIIMYIIDELVVKVNTHLVRKLKSRKACTGFCTGRAGEQAKELAQVERNFDANNLRFPVHVAFSFVMEIRLQ